VAQEKSASDKKVADLQQQLGAFQKTTQQKETAIQDMEKELDRITISLSAVQQENIFLNNELAEAKKSLQTIQGDLENKYSRKQGELEDKVSFLMGVIDQKDALLQEQVNLVAEKEKQISALTREADDLAKDYFAILDKNVSLSERLERLEEQQGAPAR